MSEAAFKRQFDEAFFEAWGDAMDGINAVYTSPDGLIVDVQVLVDTDVQQFGDDGAPVSEARTFISLRLAQLSPLEPEAGAEVSLSGGGGCYRLVQRVEGSDESISRWLVSH